MPRFHTVLCKNQTNGLMVSRNHLVCTLACVPLCQRAYLKRSCLQRSYVQELYIARLQPIDVCLSVHRLSQSEAVDVQGASAHGQAHLTCNTGGGEGERLQVNSASTLLFVACIDISLVKLIVTQAELLCCCCTVQSKVTLQLVQMLRQA